MINKNFTHLEIGEEVHSYNGLAFKKLENSSRKLGVISDVVWLNEPLATPPRSCEVYVNFEDYQGYKYKGFVIYKSGQGWSMSFIREDGSKVHTWHDGVPESEMFSVMNFGEIPQTIEADILKWLRQEDDESYVGTWVFNETLDITLDGIFRFSFKCYTCQENLNGTGFKFINNDTIYVIYDDNDNHYYDYYECGDWYGDRTITILEQPADTEFITWLKANATKID